MKSSKILNIGHRGHAQTTENTLASLHEAVDMGAVMLEFDVRLSSDGVPVVFHDPELERLVPGETGLVKERSFQELKSFQMGARKLPIPSLEEVLNELLPRVPLNIEMKFESLDYRPLAHAVLKVVRQVRAEKKVLVSSFFHQSLEILNRAAPEVATAPLFGCETGAVHEDDFQRLSALKPWRNDLPFSAPAMVVWNEMIDEELASSFRDRNLTLLTYTVDEVVEMERLMGLGLTGIITNRPERLQTLLS